MKDRNERSPGDSGTLRRKRKDDETERKRSIKLFGRTVPMPKSRRLRIAIGCLLIVFGCLGFLPILGFWMIPLGLLVLSQEFATVRRWRRNIAVWWGRRRQTRQTRPR